MLYPILKMLSLFLFLVWQILLLAAWVAGYLDPYQKQLQEIILKYLGETKVSYGLKSMFRRLRLCSTNREALILTWL